MDVGNSPPEFSDRCLAARAPEAQLDGKQQVLVALAIAVMVLECVQNRTEAKRSLGFGVTSYSFSSQLLTVVDKPIMLCKTLKSNTKFRVQFWSTDQAFVFLIT